MRGVSGISVQLILISLGLALLASNTSLAHESDGLVIYSPILGIKSEPKKFSIPLLVTNLLGEAKEVSFDISHPEGWSCNLFYIDYGVSKIFLKNNESMNLTLIIEPGPNVSAGIYNIIVTALSGQVKSNALKIEFEIIKPSVGVEVVASSTEVTGLPGSIFSFYFNIKNNYYKDLTLGLSAKVPEGWYTLGFKPSPYENRVISDITLKAHSTYWGVTLEVWCPEYVKPGTYPVRVVMSEPSEGIREELEFRAIVTGRAYMELKTEGDRLSYSVEAGGTIKIPLIINNTGTLPLRDISFYSYAPSGWRISILPDRITGLPPGGSATAVLYLEVPSGTISGDYSVDVRALSMEASREIKLRITVTKTTYWGVVGVAIILGAVLALILTFRRYGRL